MNALKKRVANLEQSGGQGSVHFVVVSPGQDREAKVRDYIAEHPEADAQRLVVVVTSIPEPRKPTPEELSEWP